jgi:hypothetical protein
MVMWDIGLSTFFLPAFFLSAKAWPGIALRMARLSMGLGERYLEFDGDNAI